MGKSLVIKNADFSAVAVDMEIVVEFPYVVDMSTLTQRNYSLNGAAWGENPENHHIVLQVPVGATTLHVTATDDSRLTKYSTFVAFLTEYNPGSHAELPLCVGEEGHHLIQDQQTFDLNIPADCEFIVFNGLSATNYNYTPSALTFDNQ